jgi:hypothetical protein
MGNKKTALDCLKEAAQLHSDDADEQPVARLMLRIACWANLGSLYLEKIDELGLPDVHQARKSFQRARDYAELLRSQFIEPRERRRIHGETMRIYELLFHTCVDIWSLAGENYILQEAVEIAEASRARNLMELLADEALLPANTPANTP